jgi:hypothetical protein
MRFLLITIVGLSLGFGVSANERLARNIIESCQFINHIDGEKVVTSWSNVSFADGKMSVLERTRWSGGTTVIKQHSLPLDFSHFSSIPNTVDELTLFCNIGKCIATELGNGRKRQASTLTLATCNAEGRQQLSDALIKLGVRAK